MKQLTRKEIIDIRAAVIMLNYRDTDCNNWEEASESWKDYCRDIAEATLEADEKAGVLMLVDSEPQVEDLVEYPENETQKASYRFIRMAGELRALMNSDTKVKIIQRANTPVYQTAKE